MKIADGAAAPILEVQHLVKYYRDVPAVNDISFKLYQGQCMGLLGPNGAGKTTTIEIIEGSVLPSSGTLYYQGSLLDQRHFRQKVGVQFQSTTLQDYLTVREQLQFFQKLYKKTTPIDTLIEWCDLGEYLDKDAKRISGGQRQRLMMALALINDPEILFLDEPTVGLDPHARRSFWNLIKNITQAQKTIVLTTHYMEEATQLCDEICIMDKGKLVAKGSPENLLKAHQMGYRLLLPKKAVPEETTHPFEWTDFNDHYHLNTQDLESTIRDLLKHKISLAQLTVQPATLEDLFLTLTGHRLSVT